jgi:hypothetical protein
MLPVHCLHFYLHRREMAANIDLFMVLELIYHSLKVCHHCNYATIAVIPGGPIHTMRHTLRVCKACAIKRL